MPTIKLNADLDDAGQVACDNCDWTGSAAAVADIQDLAERLEPGGVVPVGECPECHALCYLMQRQGQFSVLHLPSSAFSASIVRLGSYPTFEEAQLAAAAAQLRGDLDIRCDRVYIIDQQHGLTELAMADLLPEAGSEA